MPLLAVCPAVRFKEFYPGTSNPLSGGYVYTVQPGTSAAFGFPPASPMTTYADALGTAPNANPIILDSNGEAPIFITGPTKVVVFDANGNSVSSQDNLSNSPSVTSTSPQFVTQTTVPTYVSSTQFTVSGNLTASYTPGTRVQAAVSGGNIYGTITAATSGGTPIITTVTVAWDNTALNNSLTAVALGVLPAGMPTASPVQPTLTLTAATVTFAPTIANMGQIILMNSTNAPTFTLPAASTFPPGGGFTVKNINATTMTITGTVDGTASPTLAQWAFKRIVSDGTIWYSV